VLKVRIFYCQTYFLYNLPSIIIEKLVLNRVNHLILIFAIVWFFSELGYLNINIPWIPLILIIVALGWIFNRFSA